MLAALDIDLWLPRTGPLSGQEEIKKEEIGQEAAEQKVAAQPVTEQPATVQSTAGPAAARLLLNATKLETGVASVPDGVRADAVPGDPAAAAPAADDRAPQLDLFCLVGAHGVLLADLAGQSKAAQRLARDIFTATMGVIADRHPAESAAGGKSARPQTRSLRFSWPPAQIASAAPLSAAESSDGANRALRGFLARQLEGAADPVLLYASSAFASALPELGIGVAEQRTIDLGDLEAMMDDGERKRVLWQTLRTL